MNDTLCFTNIHLFDDALTPYPVERLSVRGGQISFIGSRSDADGGEDNERGAYLLRPFCDYHYHLPGSALYDLFGVNLCEYAVSEYGERVAKIPASCPTVRGFGWDVAQLKTYFSQTEQTPLAFLDALCPDRPAVLFSQDFHSCWCNSVALSILAAEGIACAFVDSEIPGGDACILHEGIAEQIFGCPRLAFSQQEIAVAILTEQERLLSLGICEVFSLMFIGASYFSVLEVLKQLEKEGRLLLTVRFAYTVHPTESVESVRKHIEESLAYSSAHLRFFGLKVYMDGVIDNHSAWLLQPYGDLPTCGDPIWEEQALSQVVGCAAEYGLPVHAHAIGDGAVLQAVSVFSRFPRPTHGRHIVAHLQLCSSETVRRMAEADIVAALQPFWFYRGKAALPLDKARLGARVDCMYPVRALLEGSVKVLFSSDCPATPEGDPLLGMRVATATKDGDRLTVAEAYAAYAVGAYEDAAIRLQEGDEATFLLFDSDPFVDRSARVCAVYLRGERVL